ncbi:DNA repair protein RecO [Alginatibacterium sediminis]|uniref:DNA repair protein RecO n=1 Tax=Alginatibacterium sediminis TaxID=2164068 RepID=UPI001314E53B|nr:DNA repair protein RecO [Alginatibacterium sediminis]
MTTENAYVLHSRPYRETSQLLTVFSSEYGKLGLVARGSRSKNSKLRGILQPFVPLRLEFRAGDGLQNLYQAEALEMSIPLFKERLYSALYLNELLYYLLDERSEYQAVFTSYQNTLFELAGQGTIAPQLRKFELILFSELGYAVAPPAEWFVEKDPRWFSYDIETGFYPLQYPTKTQQCFSQQQLYSLANFDAEHPQELELVKRFCRLLSSQLLAGRTLKSRELFTSRKKESK